MEAPGDAREIANALVPDPERNRVGIIAPVVDEETSDALELQWFTELGPTRHMDVR